ncbi:UNVERIFIED_CONTAM: hypothetical protein GTU68_018389 [Idotea baltica]|nr:hypothetical protein [Idotea baltica]
MEGLGISDEDEARLAEEISVVFHAAATINFQEPMRVAVNLNILGTKRVVNLAKKMTKLKAFVHVSTAYGNCHLPEINEEMYPSPIDPAKLIQMTEWLDDDMLESLTAKLVHPRPNTYTYTKALAEHVLVTDGCNLPVVIIRPAIVCGSWKEPTPGWVDNMFAFTGLLIGMGKGFLRSLYIKNGIKLDFIPVDVAINLMITTAWNTDVKQYIHKSPVPIYCASTGSQLPLTIEKLDEILRETVWKVPLDSPLWFPDGSAKTSKFVHNLHVLLVNIIPAYIGDLVLRLLGKKPIAMKLTNRMIKAINALEYFMLHDWTFSNVNVRNLWTSLSPIDQQAFHFDISDLNWKEYIENYQMGCKKFIMKEELSSLPTAKRTLRILYWLHRLAQLVMAYAAWCVVSSDSATCIYSGFISGASYCLSMAPVLAAAEEAADPALTSS